MLIPILERYAAPIGKTEEEKCKNAIRMVRDALKYIGYTDDGKEIRTLTEGTFALDMRSGSKNIVLLTQGSYANKTNIPKQSDVDVAVILESTFTTKYRAGVTREASLINTGVELHFLYRCKIGS